MSQSEVNYFANEIKKYDFLRSGVASSIMTQTKRFSAFADMILRIKKRYTQVAEYLGIVCRLDINPVYGDINLNKLEKLMSRVLEEVLEEQNLIALSVVSYQEDEQYIVRIVGHLNGNAWDPYQGLSSMLVSKVVDMGFELNINVQSGEKVAYDIIVDIVG